MSDDNSGSELSIRIFESFLDDLQYICKDDLISWLEAYKYEFQPWEEGRQIINLVVAEIRKL